MTIRYHLDEVDGSLEVWRRHGGLQTVARIAAAQWGSAYGAYLAGSLGWQRLSASPPGREGLARRAHARLAVACDDVVDLLPPAILEDCQSQRVVVTRPPKLLQLSVAFLMRISSRGVGLDVPLEVNPFLPAEVADEIASGARPWPGWNAVNACLLLPRDFGEVPANRSLEPGELVRTLELQQGIADLAAAARRRGTVVLHDATVEDLVDALAGDYGAHVQVVAHAERTDGGDRRVLLADGWCSLRRLAHQLARLRREHGWRSPISTLDLGVCDAAEAAAELASLGGLPFVTTFTRRVPALLLVYSYRRTYLRGRLDGSRSWGQEMFTSDHP